LLGGSSKIACSGSNISVPCISAHISFTYCRHTDRFFYKSER
jgi:hypothetical protein